MLWQATAQLRRDQRGGALGKLCSVKNYTVRQNISFGKDQISENWAEENIAINSSI